MQFSKRAVEKSHERYGSWLDHVFTGNRDVYAEGFEDGSRDAFEAFFKLLNQYKTDTTDPHRKLTASELVRILNRSFE